MSPETGRVSATKPLELHANRVGGFTVAVVDPPWENASAKRARKYPTLVSDHCRASALEATPHPFHELFAMTLPPAM